MRIAVVRRSGLLAVLLAILASTEGCRAIEGIFKAGFWSGIVMAIVVVATVRVEVEGGWFQLVSAHSDVSEPHSAGVTTPTILEGNPAPTQWASREMSPLRCQPVRRTSSTRRCFALWSYPC